MAIFNLSLLFGHPIVRMQQVFAKWVVAARSLAKKCHRRAATNRVVNKIICVRVAFVPQCPIALLVRATISGGAL